MFGINPYPVHQWSSMPKFIVKFARLIRYQLLLWSSPWLAMISIGLRRANSVTASQTAAVVPNIAFQYLRIGNSDAIASVIAAMLIGPADTVLIEPRGRKSHGI